MKQWKKVLFFVFLVSAGLGYSISSQALQLDWNGQFWFDNHWLNNYQLQRSRPGFDDDTWLRNRGGTYVRGTGEKNVVWYSAFFRLKPTVVVNDSIQIKSEFHIGSPIYGFLGRGYPTTVDERFNITGAQKENFAIGAQRYWLNLITDFGTIELGRAPVHWGLGAIWNSGDKLFDHYQNTGDMIRLISKFGNFYIAPSLVKVAVGNNLAGATDAAGNTINGNDDVTDYDIAAKYDNTEEDFDFGVKWTHRVGNASQRTILFSPNQVGSRRISFNIFDFYAKKKLGLYTFGGEVPLFSGSIGALDGANEFEYKTVAFVMEGTYTSDMWDIGLKFGHVPGQPPTSVGDRKFRAVYLNKNYGLGLIMFHYNIYGLANNNPDTLPAGADLNSPFDAPIVNARYAALTPEMKLDKWTLKAAFIIGYADEKAQATKRFYNYNQRRFFDADQNQSSFLGKEFDLGASFRWDENFLATWDFGLWLPGSYYKFSNDAGLPIDADMMFASQVRVGVTF